MMLLQRIFSNKAFLHVLKNIGIVALVILTGLAIVAFISIPVWCITHAVHHSHFTWYLTWFLYALIAAVIVGILVATGDNA